MATVAYFIPTINLFGQGSSKEVGERIKLAGGKKILIVTGGHLSKDGTADAVVKTIEAAGIKAVVFGGSQPNPTDTNVEAGLKVYKEEKCDSIVSLGGGSAHDCAKGIGILASNGGKIKDYEGIDVSKNPFVPFIAINTTAGTASEMTRFCIITDTERHVKMAILDWRCTPIVSINDSDLMASMPAGLTAATGMDALTHAVEAYVSTIANPLTDSAALMAMKLIAKYLPKAVGNGPDMIARDQMAYAEFLAGMAFNNASLGYVHAMAHQLGGFYNLPHGVCNAILLPIVSQFNILTSAERFGDIAEALGENITGLSVTDAAQLAIDAIKKLSVAVGIPATLAELGVKEKDFEVMAGNAKKDACQFTNPRTATLDQVIALYKEAL
jgi:alcohol dehydrogenase